MWWSLARIDQIQRIFLSGYFKYPFITYMVQEYILFTTHNILYKILVDKEKIFAPIFSKGIERTEEDFVQPQRNALHLDGAKTPHVRSILWLNYGLL